MGSAVLQSTNLDSELIRADFPILLQSIYRQKKLVYLDNAATTHRPNSVIEAMTQVCHSTYGNVHRGNHWLSEKCTEQFETARRTVARFINAPNEREVIFTSGTTAAINLVARAWGDDRVGKGDEILLTEMEHHSNIVPWQQLASRTGAVIRFVPMTNIGTLDLNACQGLLSERTRVFAFTAVSNVLGTINPVQELVRLAKSKGVLTFVDAAQHVPHDELDVQNWAADFVAFSGHKMLGPNGIGILHGRFNLLEKMPPFLGGGSMISRVGLDGFEPGEVPAKFEAGTPPIVEAIGLGAAIDYLERIGMANIHEHERVLTDHAARSLSQVNGMRIYGPTDQRGGIVSFAIDGVHPQDLAKLLDFQGVAIRAGHHCAMPLHDRLGISASCRASFYVYNTLAEVDFLVDMIKHALAKLR